MEQENEQNPANLGNQNVPSDLPTELPNSTAVLVLGICSIVFGCGGIGLVLGIIGISMAKKGRALYAQNPEKYAADYGKLNAGRIMSIIGIVLGALVIIYYVVVVLIFGTALMWGSSLPSGM